MILYQGTADEFSEAVEENTIIEQLQDAFRSKLGRNIPPQEQGAYTNSLSFIERWNASASKTWMWKPLPEYTKPTLEKFSGELLLSLEYLAREESELYLKNFKALQQHHPFSIIYLPIIVTTANLYTMKFDPSNVDITDGKVTKSNLAPVEFVRLRKNLATSIEYDKAKMYLLDDINKENDRTVFIVQANSFIKFLSMLKLY